MGKKIIGMVALMAFSFSLAACGAVDEGSHPVVSNDVSTTAITIEEITTAEVTEDAMVTKEEALGEKTQEELIETAAMPEYGTTEYLENKSYYTSYKLFPSYAYEAGDWLDENGNLTIPFKDEELPVNIGIKSAAYYIPVTVLDKIDTAQLLNVCMDWFDRKLTIMSLFEVPSTALENLTYNCQAFDELMFRDDTSKVIYEDYLKRDFLYDGAVDDYTIQFFVCYEELMLARDEAFDRLTDEQKDEVIDKAAKLHKQRLALEAGEYQCAPAPFFAYIAEQKKDGSSKWFDYIMERHSELEEITHMHGWGFAQYLWLNLKDAEAHYPQYEW